MEIFSLILALRFIEERSILIRGKILTRDEILSLHRKALVNYKPDPLRPSISSSTIDSTNRSVSSTAISGRILADLTPIAVRDLHLGYVHLGRSLHVRNIVKPFSMVGLHTVVEDISNQNYKGKPTIIRLSLYNFLPPGVNPKDALPIGCEFIVIEPYCKMGQDMIPFIRCDNPEQIIMKSTQRDTIKKGESSPLSLKDRGNKLFVSKHYDDAIMCYTEALENLSENSNNGDKAQLLSTLYSNRAAAHLALQSYHNAHEDAVQAISFDSSNVKAKYRAVKALFGCGRYKECMNYLNQGTTTRNATQNATQNTTQNATQNVTQNATQTTQKATINKSRKKAANRRSKKKKAPAAATVNSNDAAIKEELELLHKVTICMAEQENGIYNMVDLIREASAMSQAPRMTNHAEYFFGGAEIRTVPGKGRGVIATKDIKAGTLIAVCRALEIVFETEISENKVVRDFNPVSGRYDTETKVSLVTKLALRVQRDQRAAHWLHDLSAKDSSSDMPPKDKSFLPTFPSEPYSSDTRTPVDIDRISSIVAKNVFAPEDSFGISPKRELGDGGTGLWIFPSYLNHSCLGNVSRYCVGDLMFMRAITDISSGSELFMQYCPKENSFEHRQSTLDWYGFTCHCDLCEYDRTLERIHPAFASERAELRKYLTDNDDLLDVKLKEIIRKFYIIHSSGNVSLSFKKSKSTLFDINSTTANIIKPAPSAALVIDLFLPLAKLGRVYLKNGQFATSAEQFAQLYWLCRSCPSGAPFAAIVNMALQVACSLAAVGDTKCANDWAQMSKKLSDEVFGGGDTFWKNQYSEAAKVLKTFL